MDAGFGVPAMTARTITIVAGTGAASLVLLVVTAMNVPAAKLAEAGRLAASALIALPDLTFSCPASDGPSLLPKIVYCARSWTFPTIVLDPTADIASRPPQQDFASAEPTQLPPSHAR